MPRIYLSPPDISTQDHASVDGVLTSNWVAPVGPELGLFEAEVASLTGVEHALAVNSGTAALHLALLLLEIGEGDQVICPSFTFAASANPICYLGAEPVFVDSETSTWNMDPQQLDQALSEESSVKAVIVVHLYGQCAQMDAIVEVCQRHGVPIIEDAAEALGASYKGRPAGSFGDFSFFSFNGNKIITTSAGGMLLSNDRTLIEKAGYLATQAREPVAHYEHKAIGYNYRMSNVLAGLGRSQLSDLPRRITVRTTHFEAYSAGLSELVGISMMPIAEQGASNHWLSCLCVDESVAGVSRDQLLEALAAADIEARPVWKPLHMQPVFSNCRVYGGSVSQQIFEQGLCLPSGSSLSAQERSEVVEILRARLDV
ncbi:MAG: DegT/DnrJ/EryC1/StrS family aminotransferase [Opitutaceae bacterium]